MSILPHRATHSSSRKAPLGGPSAGVRSNPQAPSPPPLATEPPQPPRAEPGASAEGVDSGSGPKRGGAARGTLAAQVWRQNTASMIGTRETSLDRKVMANIARGASGSHSRDTFDAFDRGFSFKTEGERKTERAYAFLTLDRFRMHHSNHQQSRRRVYGRLAFHLHISLS